MTDLRKAAEMALEALENAYSFIPLTMGSIEQNRKAVEALRQALSQPEQEPVAWGMQRKDGVIIDVICPEEHSREPGDYTIPLYTAPPKREWVGLTPDEISELSEQAKKFCNDMFNTPDYDYFAGALWRAIEAKLKEKNGG